MLTARQMRVLLPTRSVSSDSESVVRPPIQRCLFGRPDPEETHRMYEEEMNKDRERFLRRFNFDVLTSRFVSKEQIQEMFSKKDSCTPERMRGYQRTKRSSPYEKQPRITDIWKEKRRMQDCKSKNMVTSAVLDNSLHSCQSSSQKS